MANHIIANLLAGLGLFFIGIRFISDHMKSVAGRGVRRLVGRFTGHPLLSALSGLGAGALIQSTSAVTFILTNLVASRLITVRNALPSITWANVGNSLLVLLAVLDVHLAALYLLGIAGLCFYFNVGKVSPRREIVGSLLGLGLLFLGLVLMKTGAAPLKDIKWVTRFLAYTRGSYWLAFLAGGFLTFVVQSSTTIAVIGIALAREGLLGPAETIMGIYGANLGSGISTLFMSSNLRGSARQLGIFQALFKLAGVLLLVPLFYAELHLQVPGMQHLVAWLSPDFGRQMAYVFLLYQVCAAIPVSALLGPLHRLLEWLSPATAEEELTRTQYIYDQALGEAETALDLVEKEQLRLIQRLPQFLDEVREETAQQPSMGAEMLRKTVNDIGAEVTAFVTDLMEQHSSRASLERALNAQNRMEVIGSLGDTLAELVAAANEDGSTAALSTFTQQLAEALHLILMAACDAAEKPNADNCATLTELTADRGEMMERVRRSFLAGEKSLNPSQQQRLMTLTTLFERAIWLLRRLGILLGASKTS